MLGFGIARAGLPGSWPLFHLAGDLRFYLHEVVVCEDRSRVCTIAVPFFIVSRFKNSDDAFVPLFGVLRERLKTAWYSP